MTVNIGCKLPHGLVIEIGLDPKTGRPTKDYEAFVLQGTLKAPAGAKFGTTPIPKSVWEAWVKKNAKLRYVLDKSVFVVP